MMTVVLCCCRAIGHIMSTLFFPVVTFLLLTLCISYWAVTAVYPSSHTFRNESVQYPEAFSSVLHVSLTFTVNSYLASSGEAVYRVMSPDVSCQYANSTCQPEVQ